MSRRVKSIIYYDGQIYNTQFRVVLIGAKSMEFEFNSIQMREVQTKIRRKVEGSTWGGITSETHLETVISSYIERENVVIELYVKFVDADGSGPSSTTVTANTGIEVEVESSTTILCSGFSSILQSGYYNVPETSIGRHLSVSKSDLNFGD
ncbi:hypothetical protein J1N35_018724 [Gossypium stocksii]|uniref:Uncharacterized protein n=1 Tax=Gossypium stocksii TaxID=47602 RepID=A0A9D3VQV9_9ROSI|nr:hypothetical protein J1N35_018724 [Gossypium stocksii]